jgi:ribosomal protein S14
MVSILQTALRDKKYRKSFKHTEMVRRYYKYLKINSRSTGFIPIRILPKMIFKNTCLVTGETRSISPKARLSRHAIKKYFPFLTGLRNSSW